MPQGRFPWNEGWLSGFFRKTVMAGTEAVLYGDASAVLSLLFEDAHSAMAVREMAGVPGYTSCRA